jgi:hypothetical protein
MELSWEWKTEIAFWEKKIFQGHIMYGTVSILKRSMSDLWWINWPWDKFLSRYLMIPFSVIAPVLHIRSFIYRQRYINLATDIVK